MFVVVSSTVLVIRLLTHSIIESFASKGFCHDIPFLFESATGRTGQDNFASCSVHPALVLFLESGKLFEEIFLSELQATCKSNIRQTRSLVKTEVRASI